jgi:hypothetical protein
MGVAEQELNIVVQIPQTPRCSFLPGGPNPSALCRQIGTPSNFSPFSFFKVEPLLAANQQNHHFILHLETQGKEGKSLDEIKAGSKQEVKAPTTYL